MKRKVIKQGHHTLTVTIPSKWAEAHGVSPGDELDVIENERSLILTKEGNASIPPSITIDLTGMTVPMIWRYISSAYRAGYDEIAVTGIGSGKKNIYSAFSYNTLDYLKKNAKNITSEHLDMSPMETISACVNRLIGVEIIDQKPNYCLIKDLSEVTDKELENSLRRIFVLLKTMSEGIEEGLKGNIESIKAINIVDTNLDRFEDFCFRVLNKTGFSTLRKTNVMHSLIFVLEMIGDELKKMAIHILEDEGNYSQIQELFRMQVNQLERFYKLFYKYDKALVMEMYKCDTDATKMAETCYKKMNDDEKELLHHLKKVGIFILSLVELRIDLEF
jgi:phosphate uptake regulator